MDRPLDSSHTIATKPALDERWFTAIHPYITELFLVLGPPHETLESLREKFDIQPFNPDLRPHGIDSKSVTNTNAELTALKTTITNEEANQYIRQAYALKIDELILQNDLLLASLRGDQVAFMEANRHLYGSPQTALFSAACAWIRQEAAAAIGDHQSPLRQVAQNVLEALPSLPGNPRYIIPSDHLFTAVRDLHYQPKGYFESLFKDQTIPEIVTPDIGDPITTRVIQSIGSTYQLVSSTDELWGVVHEAQQVVRPDNYRLTREAFIGIVAHEIGSHLLERVNGDHQPLRLLSVGLDKYEASNEGRAFLREQIVYNSPYTMLQQPSWEHIILLYVAASFAAGIHQAPYPFMQLYQTMYAICLFFQTRRQPDNPVFALQTARTEAWHVTVRVMKGTSGIGGAYLKALVYLDGNIKAWHIAKTQPSTILFGDSGKFDIGRADHLTILEGLGIVPAAA